MVSSDADEGFGARSVERSAECSEVLSDYVAAGAGTEWEESASVSTLWTSITR